jgi:hypothetical protein
MLIEVGLYLMAEVAHIHRDDWTPTIEDEEHLTEDFYQFRSGRWIVDAGWYPQGDVQGHFRCVVVLDNKWDRPLEVLETRDPEAMERWMLKRMKDVARRAGR